MIIRTMKDVIDSDRSIHCPHGGFISNRYLLESDKMGFTMTKTIIPVTGKFETWHYKNHLEACFCIKGKGKIINDSNGKSYDILPNTMYALDKNDRHHFKAIEEVELICVFNPPLTGKEVHAEDGSYKTKEEI